VPKFFLAISLRAMVALLGCLSDECSGASSAATAAVVPTGIKSARRLTNTQK
jgi:hypothetical protein